MGGMMRFLEAMRALEEGAKVRRACWNKSEFIQRGSDGTIFDETKSNTFNIEEWFFGEWELYEEPKRTLCFLEVLQGLKKGKRFARNGAYVSIVLSQDGKNLCHCIGGRMNLNMDDFEATDWMEFP
jgi:hypothetical protein